MSPKLEPGRYKIIAVGANNSLTGAGPTRPPFSPIHVNSSVNIWEVKPQPETDYYRLTLVDTLPFTGVEGDTVVVADAEDLDVNWHIKYHHELGGYSIAYRPPWPNPVWTVINDGEIMIRQYELFPAKNQLFTFEPCED